MNRLCFEIQGTLIPRYAHQSVTSPPAQHTFHETSLRFSSLVAAILSSLDIGLPPNNTTHADRASHGFGTHDQAFTRNFREKPNRDASLQPDARFLLVLHILPHCTHVHISLRCTVRASFPSLTLSKLDVTAQVVYLASSRSMRRRLRSLSSAVRVLDSTTCRQQS